MVSVFGMVERTPERKLVLKVVEKRNAETLLPIIKRKRYVLEGLIVLTDCWRAYNGINELVFEHGTVNHSLNYVRLNLEWN